MSTVTARPFADPIEKVAHIATTDDTADETKKFRKLILREISGMQLKLDDLANSVTVLLQSRRLENARCMPPDDVPDIIHSFPVDEKCLMDLEHWLESNAEHKKHLAQELSRIGGSTVKEVTRRIMYRVFSNEVGSQYSWEGAKKKKPFKKLAVASAILNKLAKVHNHLKILDGVKSPKAVNIDSDVAKVSLIEGKSSPMESTLYPSERQSDDDEEDYAIVEIGPPGSGIFVTDLQWTAAISRGTYKAMATSLVTSLFPTDVLLKSNYEGGESKFKNKDGLQPKYDALDPKISRAILYSVRGTYPRTFTEAGVGQAVNVKLTNLRAKANALQKSNGER